MPGEIVDADGPEQQAVRGHQQRARQRGRRHVGEEKDEAEHEAPLYSGGPRNRRAKLASGGAIRVSITTPEGCRRSRSRPRRYCLRRAGAALARHGIAVDAGHHRGCFARNPHQDRGGRAAILGAVIDAGQHYDRLGGVEAEGRRQQNADPGQRLDVPGSTPTQGADDAAPRKPYHSTSAAARQRSPASGCRRSCRPSRQNPNRPCSSGVLSATVGAGRRSKADAEAEGRGGEERLRPSSAISANNNSVIVMMKPSV